MWTPAAQADLIARALLRIGIDRAIFVGHSWGTMAALAMALDRPQMVRGLVLVSGYYYPTARPDVPPVVLGAVPLIGDLMAATISPLLARITGPIGVKASFAPAEVPPDFADMPVDVALRPSQIRAAAADAATMVPAALALSRRYGELSVPVIAFAGEGDLIVHPAAHAERLVRDVPDAELRIVAGQGHMLHHAVPDQVVAAIEELDARS